jgi:excisionase family DNA binding protein
VSGSSPPDGPRRGELVPAEEFVSPPTVAAWLAIPVPVLYDAAERGLLPAIRDGGRWRFHGPTVRRWLDEEGPTGMRRQLAPRDDRGAPR